MSTAGPGEGGPRSVRLLDSVGPLSAQSAPSTPDAGLSLAWELGKSEFPLCGAETGGKLVRACVASGSGGRGLGKRGGGEGL